jgi:hypothetical protein
MIVEDERGTYLQYNRDNNTSAVITPAEVTREGRLTFDKFIENYDSMKNAATHQRLRNDLIKHQWDVKGRRD